MTKKKSIIMTLLALLFSVVGIFFAYQYIQIQINKHNQPVPTKEAEKPVELTELVGLLQPVKKGTIIQRNMVAPLSVPKNIAYSADYIPWTKLDLLENKKLIVDLPATAAVRLSDLVDSSLQVFSDVLKPGERAVTIPVDAYNSIFGYLQPKDFIDLVLIDKNKKIRAIPLLDNIQVLAVDTIVTTPATVAEVPNTGEINTITIKVTPQQAQKIAIAKTKGTFMVTLRNSKDKETNSARILHESQLTPVYKGVQVILGGQQ